VARASPEVTWLTNTSASTPDVTSENITNDTEGRMFYRRRPGEASAGEGEQR
jgi:hypothetical protein